MSIIGIVCEFNPFHNGHKYLIDSVKKDGDIVVCVMSGNYVQRGEPAIFPKDVRVEVALKNGADIVLELPFVYATASAEFFAKNAVKILDSFGCDKIAFGTENASIDDLLKVTDVLLNDNFDIELKKQLAMGISYPAARELAIKQFSIDIDISSPNNILAIEYLKAVRELKSPVKVIAVNRIGAGYNENCAVDNIASATYIRNLIKNNENFENYVPQNAIDIYNHSIREGKIVSYQKYENVFLGLLRSKSFDNLLNIANMAEGLENRIIDAIKNCTTIEDIYNYAKTKRFTHSRIRRAVLCVALDIYEEDLKLSVPYCRLLGYNDSVADKLGDIVKRCKLPFVVKYSDFCKYTDNNTMRLFELENKSTDIYNIILDSNGKCCMEMTFQPKKT